VCCPSTSLNRHRAIGDIPQLVARLCARTNKDSL
jgi:hypothetical protein